jgi:hypothetical protein
MSLVQFAEPPALVVLGVFALIAARHTTPPMTHTGAMAAMAPGAIGSVRC